MEMSGANVFLVEQTAHELCRFVDPRAPADGLRALYAAYDNPEPIAHQLVYRTDPRTTIQHQIWWGEEFAPAQRLYRTIVLDEHEYRRFEILMDSFCASGALPNHTEEEVRQHPDAITICQVATANGRIVVSPDSDFHGDRVTTNAWAQTQHRAGYLEHPTIVARPELELESWCADDPEHVLKTIIAAAWPEDPQASQPAVEAEFNDLLNAMQRVNYLNPTALACQTRYAQHPEPVRLLETVRNELPERARQADARHPANPRNKRNWATPADDVRTVIGQPKWSVYIANNHFHILENHSGTEYTTVDAIPVHERERIAKTLIDRNIEVRGIPRHDGSSTDSGGFSSGLNGLIDAELEKEREISR